MSLIRVEGLDYPVVAGLEWETVPSKELAQRKQEATLDNKLVFSQKIKAGGGKQVTFGTGPNEGYEGAGQLISLAAWLNASAENATMFVVERVQELASADDDEGEPKYWFCFVNNGEIIQGTDIVADLDTVNMLATDIASAVGEESQTFNGNAAHQLSIYQQQDESPAPLSEILAPSKVKQAKYRAKGSNRILVISLLGAILLTVIAGGSYAYYAHLAEEEAAKERAKQQQMRRIADAKREWAETLESSKRLAQGQFVLQALVRDKVLKFRPNIIGWRLSELNCSTGNCRIVFANESLTRTEVVTSSVQPMCDTFSIDRAGIEAACEFSYQDRPETVDMNDDEWLLTESDWNNFRTDVMDLARLNNAVAYSFGEKREVSFAGKGLVPNAELFDVASYSIAFPLSSFGAIESLFLKYPGISVVNMELTGGQDNFTISGLLYQESTQ